VGLAAASVEALIGKVPAGLLRKRRSERDAGGEWRACVSGTIGSNEEKNICNISDKNTKKHMQHFGPQVWG